mgnify:CR=1 FL=1
MVNFPPLIHPFKPSACVDWRIVRLDRANLLRGGYADPLVQSEFRRFINRDLSNLFYNIIFTFAPPAYPITQWLYYPVWTTVMVGIVGSIILASATMDLYLHTFKDPSDPGTAARRHIISVIVSLIAPWICAGGAPPAYADCFRLRDPFSAMWKRGDTFDSTKQCVEIVNPYVLVVMFVVFFCTPLTGNWVAVGLGLTIVYHLIGSVVAKFGILDMATAKQVVLWGIYTVLALVTIIVTYVRDRVRMNQFEQAVMLERIAKGASERSDEADALLCAMLPQSALRRLLAGEPVRDAVPFASVFFSDMVSFTNWSSSRSAKEVVRMLNVIVPIFDDWSVVCGVEKVKTIGDAYWAVAGLPDPMPDHADRICRFARGLLERLTYANELNPEWNGIHLRVGVHSGPLPGAILGTRQIAYEPFGPTNDVTEEIEKHGIADQVLMSEVTRNLLINETATHDPVMAFDLPDVGSIACYRCTTGEDPDDAGITESSPDQPLGPHDLAKAAALLDETRTQATSAKPSLLTQRTAREQFLIHRGHQSSFRLMAAGDQNLSQLIERYSAPKYQFPIPFADYADAEAEAEYRRWARPTHAPMRHAARLMVVLFPAVIMICLAIEGASAPTSSWALFAISEALALMALALSSADRLPLIDVLLTVASGTAMIIAAGLVPTSLATNDISYLFYLTTVPMFLGTTLISWPVLVLMTGPFYVPIIYFMFPSINYWSHVVLCIPLTYVFLSFLVRFVEFHLRQQFLDEQVSKFYHAQVLEVTQAQRALLETVVPERIITPLMRWMATGLKPQDSIVRVYPQACVAFVKLYCPAKYTSSTLELTDVGDHAVTEAAQPGPQDWMLQAHVEVDAVLSNFFRIEKIKTVGDIVMLAGPFLDATTGTEATKGADATAVLPEADLQACADELLAICTLCRGVADIRAGLHVGEVVGAVLGTSRLAFDVFGDSVNVASRVMTTCPGVGSVAASAEFCEVWNECQRRPGSSILGEPGALRFDGGTVRHFKGKGDVNAFNVVHFPTDTGGIKARATAGRVRADEVLQAANEAADAALVDFVDRPEAVTMNPLNSIH